MRAPNGSNSVQIKNQNRQAILLQLLRAPMSRVELAHQLSVSPTTITNLINELIAEGWVVTESAETTFHSSGRGRPRTRLAIDKDAGSVVGVQIGIGSLRVAQVNLLGHLMCTVSKDFAVSESAESVIDLITRTVESLKYVDGYQSSPILGIGVGASGLVDAKRGINLTAPSLGWQDVAIADLLQAKLGLPVSVENNVRAMALAESYFGRFRESESLTFIFGRIGIAAGLVMNGTLMRGSGGGAGEIGHTTIVPTGGNRCRCGRHGCLETIVTQPSLIHQLTQTAPQVAAQLGDLNHDPIAQFEAILKLFADGAAPVEAAFQEQAHFLGIAIINLVNTLNPQHILLGGMYAQGADIYLPALRQQVAESAFGRIGEAVKIDASSFGLDTGVIGAAAVGLTKFFYEAGSHPAPATALTL